MGDVDTYHYHFCGSSNLGQDTGRKRDEPRCAAVAAHASRVPALLTKPTMCLALVCPPTQQALRSPST